MPYCFMEVYSRRSGDLQCSYYLDELLFKQGTLYTECLYGAEGIVIKAWPSRWIHLILIHALKLSKSITSLLPPGVHYRAIVAIYTSLMTSLWRLHDVTINITSHVPSGVHYRAIVAIYTSLMAPIVLPIMITVVLSLLVLKEVNAIIL